MSSRFAPHAIVFALALAALGAEAAWADHGPRNQPQNAQNIQNVQNAQSGGGLPASVRRIERETGGEVLKAQPMQRDGREVYRVKVLTPQGRIRVVEDAPPPRDQPDRPAQHDRLPEQ
jgi:hypothetical protein